MRGRTSGQGVSKTLKVNYIIFFTFILQSYSERPGIKLQLIRGLYSIVLQI